MYDNRNVVVAGGTGTIGIPLVRRLIELQAKVTVISMDSPAFASMLFGDKVLFQQSDLTVFDNCLAATKGQDYVFNLVGIKGGLVIELIVPIAMVSLGVDFAVHAVRRYQEERSAFIHVSAFGSTKQKYPPGFRIRWTSVMVSSRMGRT